MANYTTNLNLTKPLQSENYNISVQNNNMDTIDTAIGDKTTLLTTEKGNLVGAINEVSSTLTTQLADKANSSTLSAHTGDSSIHVTSGDKSAWNAKVDATDPSIITGKIYAYKNIGGSL